ncbi:MAG: DUF1631 family protein, partial [Lacisediminimonas sp.]|nr:DUF1631 family protein [Lacisediminimonas sp.]
MQHSTIPASPAGPIPADAPVRQAALLPKLVDIGHALAGAQIEAFRYRLADALLKLSETSLRPAEEQASFHAYNYLRNQAPVFCETLSEIIHTNTAAALHDLELGRPAAPRLDPKADNFEAMEDQVLQDEVNLALEQHCADALAELNVRIAALLGRERIDTDTNPWRPQVFVQSVCQAWRNIDGERASLRVMLGQLGPGCFLRLDAVYAALNAALAGKGILPDIKAAVRARKREMATATFAATTSPILLARGKHYNRVRDWLLSPGKGQAAEVADHLNLPDLFGAQDAVGNWQANTINVAVGPRLFGHLTRLQQQLDASVGEAGGLATSTDTSAAAPAATATVLRHIRSGLPDGVLTTVDDNTIELLARIVD